LKEEISQPGIIANATDMSSTTTHFGDKVEDEENSKTLQHYQSGPSNRHTKKATRV
jgi:hypothetical protein